jgi:hypothetical protein
MQGSLGEKIAEGATAEIHAWAPGQVVKLFKPSVPPFVGGHEANMTRAVFAAGGPAPEVLGEVNLEGRFGIVLPRLDGPTLLQVLLDGAITPAKAGAILASLSLAVHQTPPPPGVPDLRTFMDFGLRLSGDLLPKSVAAGVLALIDRLPRGETLCHCDVHPGNVIMTADGPRLIDWTGARRAGAPLELAVSHLLLTELQPESFGDPARQLEVDAALQAEYARLTGADPVTLSAAMEAHLPIVRVFFLLGGLGVPATRERVLSRVVADLGSDDD